MKVYYSDFSELRVYPFQFPIHIAQKNNYDEACYRGN